MGPWGRQRLVGLALAALCAYRVPIQASPQATPDINSLLTRIGSRVAGYHRQSQHVLLIENSTVQPIASTWAPAGFARTVESEVRVEFDAADGTLLPGVKVVRDIRRVNGKPPRERDARARAGCTDPNPLSPEPLAFLLPEHRDHYRFTSVRAGKDNGRAALIIDFVSANRESKLTLVEDERGHEDCFDWSGPLATRGRLWVDPDTHDVLRVDRGVDGVVDVLVPEKLQRRHGFGPSIVLERDDLTMRYTAVTFSEPAEIMRRPQSTESVTVLRSGLQSIRRTDTFSQYRRFLGTGRIVK